MKIGIIAAILAGASGPSADAIEREIAYRHNAIVQCERIMTREREGAKISGYVDREAMHGCGVAIVEHKRVIAQDYLAYRKMGGTKTIAQINQRTDAGPASPYQW